MVLGKELFTRQFAYGGASRNEMHVAVNFRPVKTQTVPVHKSGGGPSPDTAKAAASYKTHSHHLVYGIFVTAA